MDSDECVGAIVCKLDLHKKVIRRGYIAMLAIDERYRRRGIGKIDFWCFCLFISCKIDLVKFSVHICLFLDFRTSEGCSSKKRGAGGLQTFEGPSWVAFNFLDPPHTFLLEQL